MAFWNKQTSESLKSEDFVEVKYSPIIYGEKTISDLSEGLKSKTTQEEIKFPKELGIKHPFNFEDAEGIYKKFPPVMGAVDKYVDFIVGPGFYVQSKDAQALDIITNFITDFNFDSILREWVKEALIKGNGYLELGTDKKDQITDMKVLDANNIYIKLKDNGNISYFNQYIGENLALFNEEKLIRFQPTELAHIPLNKIGDNPYGYGIISSSILTVDYMLGSIKDMHYLVNRKANVPYHVKVGNIEKNIMPTQEDVNAIGKKLEYLNNKQEWVTDPTWDIKLLDFGNIGEKFDSVLNMDMTMLLFGLQVPEVLMGKGSVPEGLAKVQMDAFERNIQSKQAEIEKVIENQIFKRVLNANGIDAHVEFEWGRPSNSEKNESITRITELIKNPFLNENLRKEIEKKLAKLMDIEEKVLDLPEVEREKEENQPTPPIPRPNESYHYHEAQENETLDNFYGMNMSVQEWVGFNLQDYKNDIISAIKEENFAFLRAIGMEEVRAGKFTKYQIESLRQVLDSGFKTEASVKEIAQRINEEVNPKTLLKMKNGKLVRDGNGRPIVSVNRERRAIMIARTETIRVAAKGQIKNYKKNKVKKVRWVATFSDRTCPTCESLNGQIFDIDDATLPPAHTMCRCTTTPVVDLVS